MGELCALVGLKSWEGIKLLLNHLSQVLALGFFLLQMASPLHSIALKVLAVLPGQL